jgi:hypothetical protein
LLSSSATADIPKRVEFDTTLDDFVDANIRMAGRTKTFRRQRTLYQWFTGTFFAAALIASLVMRSLTTGLPVPGTMWAVIVGLGLILGVLAGYGSRRYFDWRVRRYYRRICRDLLQDASSMRFELELREAGVWTRCRGIETSFAWSRLTNIIDAADSIELWFDPGLVVVRNRAFATEGERREFLNLARAMGQST